MKQVKSTKKKTNHDIKGRSIFCYGSSLVFSPLMLPESKRYVKVLLLVYITLACKVLGYNITVNVNIVVINC